MSSDEESRGSMQTLDDHGECDTCGREEQVAILESGQYCWRHIPAGDLNRVLKDLSGR